MPRKETFGRFELRQPLGRGGVGDVRLAFDPDRGEEIALKLIRISTAEPEMLAAEKEGLALQEQICRRIPQVAAIYEHGEYDGHYYVSMEYIDGTDLSKLLSSGVLGEERASHIAHQLCRILDKSHRAPVEIEGRRGIVHGDIKPENIRLQDGDTVRLLDFGVAKSIALSRKYTRNVFGSIPYLSPERLDPGILDHHADLWATGVVLYQMVSGRLPFGGRTTEKIQGRISSGEQPRALPDKVSADLRRILDRCLDLDRDRRYQTAAGFAADLAAFRDGRPFADATMRSDDDPGRTRRTSTPREDPTMTRRTHETRGGRLSALPARVSRRPRLLWTAAIVVLLALVGLEGFVWVEVRQLRQDLVPGKAIAPGETWQRLRRLDWISPLGLGLSGLQDQALTSLMGDADRVLENFRDDALATLEGDWQRACEILELLHSLDGEDSTLAKLRVSQAHLARIEAQTLSARGEKDRAGAKWAEAARGFDLATRLAPSQPDPHLGLAEVYSHGEVDLARLEQAHRAAAKRGHRGRRAKAQLADAYLNLGESLHFRSGNTDSKRQRVQLLYEARDLFEDAVAHYGEMSGFPGTVGGLEKARTGLEAVERQLKRLGYF